ncbi:hypothetical protein KCU87_g427, partial [Aureobasidium melanogenum]
MRVFRYEKLICVSRSTFCVSGDESVRAQGMRRRCCCPSSPGPEVKGPAIRSATHGRYNNEQRAVMIHRVRQVVAIFRSRWL